MVRRPPTPLTRRALLVLSARAGALTALGLVACDDETEATPDAARGAGPDARPPDMGMEADALLDAGRFDAAMQDAAPQDAAPLDAGADAEPEAPIVTKGPWGMVAGADQIRLRFETRTADSVSVTLITPDGRRVEGAPTLTQADIVMDWPPGRAQSDWPDRPGTYTLHEVLFTDLEPGARYSYEIAPGDQAIIEGGFRAPAGPGQPTRLAWLSDTMWPYSMDTAVLMNSEDADVMLHGGDIQYMTNPLDTWNGYFAYFGPAFRKTLVHHCVGNHEEERFNEIESHYDRLFGGQGDATSRPRYHAFTAGSVRVLMLNSEDDFLRDEAQITWLTSQLEAARANPDIAYPIVGFHRPFFTFSRSGPNLGTRARMHALFTEYGVPLVLTGHNHCYERFEVDGITYIVDGGGGAFQYNINENREEIAAARPEELDLRITASQTYGVLRLEVQPGGLTQATRTSVDGEVVDRFEIGG